MFQVYLVVPSRPNMQLVLTVGTVEEARSFVNDPANAGFLLLAGGNGAAFKIFEITASEISATP